MSAASGGYCGNFPPPTTPFSGTAYFGSHASTGSSSTLPKSTHSSGQTATNPYTNPSLFAQPPQPGPGTGNAPSGGNGAGNGASGIGNGNGNGKSKKTH
jgi:hypothetical protein